MDTVLERINGYVAEGGPHHIVTVDASMVVMAADDAELRRIVAQADLATPDSTGILWAGRRLGRPFPQRVSGVDIVTRLLDERRYSLFFLGAAPGVAEAAAARVTDLFPGVRIAGCQHGYFGPDDEPGIVAQIRQAAPDVLLVAMGIPRQEKFIDRHRQELGTPVMIGVGGTLDVLAGRVRRAPRWMQRLGIEWVWRILSDPSKIHKVKLLPVFAWRVIRQSTRSHRGV